MWFGVVLRGDNEEILDRRAIQRAGRIAPPHRYGFPLTIGPDCTIGHHVTLHGCTIGENSLIGMGATLLNGARIGRNSLVGANALVTEGKEFPDNSLIVGGPAKLVRTVGRSRDRQAARERRALCRQLAALCQGSGRALTSAHRIPGQPNAESPVIARPRIKRVNVARPLVGVHGLEIGDMAHDVELGRNSIGAVHVARGPARCRAP